MFSVMILAAGGSTRMGGVNKQLLTLYGETVIHRSARAFCGLEKIEEVVVVCRPGDMSLLEKELAGLPVRVIPSGGETRQQSVENTLPLLSARSTHLAIHDGARPLVRREDILAVLEAAEKQGGALLGVMARDTIKVVRDGMVVETPDRRHLFVAQTPQAFRMDSYKAAMAEAAARGLDFTDDAQLFEQTGRPVAAVPGHSDNIKITTPEDIPLAEGMLSARE